MARQSHKKELTGKTDQHSIRREIERRKWTWIGHALWKEITNVMVQAIDGILQGKENQEDQNIVGVVNVGGGQ